MNGSTSDERGTYAYGDSAEAGRVRFELSPESEPVVVGSGVLLMYPEGDVDVVRVVYMDHAQVVVETESGKRITTVHESIGLGVNDDLTFVLADGCTTFEHKPARRLFTPQFPRLFAAEGTRCDKVTFRSGRVSLQCVRRTHGSEINHLMDIMDRDAKPGFLARTEDNLITEAISSLDAGDPAPMRDLVASGVIPTDAPVAIRAQAIGSSHDADPTCICAACVAAFPDPEPVLAIDASPAVRRPVTFVLSRNGEQATPVTMTITEAEEDLWAEGWFADEGYIVEDVLYPAAD